MIQDLLEDTTPKKQDQGLPKVMSSVKATDDLLDSPQKSKSVPSSENKLPKYEAKINELQNSLDEKDEALGKFAIMNDRLMKEKLEVQNQNKELSNKLKAAEESLKAAEDNVLNMSYKAHQMQEQINLLTSQLEEYKKLASAPPVKKEVYYNIFSYHSHLKSMKTRLMSLFKPNSSSKSLRFIKKVLMILQKSLTNSG